jgi:hypothetical protein
MIWPVSDRYGIPDNYVGQVEDDFFGIVGRIVMLASLVELKLFDLLCTLDFKPQDQHAGKPAGEMIKQCRDQLEAHEAALRDTAVALLDRVAAALEQRNSVVHSAWPNPTLDRAFGWRPGRPRRQSDDGRWTVEIETDELKLTEVIAELVLLVDALPRLTNKGGLARATASASRCCHR